MNQSKLEQLEQLLHQADPQGLFKTRYSVPSNQYDGEALQLALKLNQYDTVASIQQKLWDVFYNNFCVSSRYEYNTLIKYKKSKEDAIKTIGTVDSYQNLAIKVKAILDE